MHQLSRGLSLSPLGMLRTGLSDAHLRITICTGQSDRTLSCRILPAVQVPPRVAQLSVGYFTPPLEGLPPRPSLLDLRRTLPMPSTTGPLQLHANVWSLCFFLSLGRLCCHIPPPPAPRHPRQLKQGKQREGEGEGEGERERVMGTQQVMLSLLGALSAELTGSLLEVLKLNGSRRLFVRPPWCLPAVGGLGCPTTCPDMSLPPPHAWLSLGS